MIARIWAEIDVSDVGFVLGFALIVVGVALIYPPAAFLVAGFLICAASLTAALAPERPK